MLIEGGRRRLRRTGKEAANDCGDCIRIKVLRQQDALRGSSRGATSHFVYGGRNWSSTSHGGGPRRMEAVERLQVMVSGIAAPRPGGGDGRRSACSGLFWLDFWLLDGSGVSRFSSDFVVFRLFDHF